MEPTQPTPNSSAPGNNSDDPLLNNSPSPKKKHEGLRSALSTILILIAAPIIAIALTSFVFQSYQVDGPSMQSTLHNGDRLIVFKLPRTLARITGNDYIPKRGDIIIFTHNMTDLGQYEENKQLIKRVIALPGERVVMGGGRLMVYNQEFPNGFNPDSGQPYAETIEDSPGEFDGVIPAGHVFVLGDNRVNSADSPDYGPVPLKDIVGKLSFRIYPLNQSEKF